MNADEYFWMFIKSYNPNQYHHLLERSLRHFLIFAVLLIITCLLLFSILILPVTYAYISSIPERTAGIEQFTLGATVNADEQVTLLERPHIVLDMEANRTSGRSITLTEEGVLYPKYLLFGTRTLPWSEVNDLKQQTAARDRFISTLIIFLLPSIIFWFVLYSMFILVIIFVLLMALGYFLPQLFKHYISFRDVAKLAILSSPSLLIMHVALYPLAPLFLWGLLITVVLFFVGVALVSEVRKQKV